MPASRTIIEGFEAKLAEIRRECEQAIAQLDAAAIRRSLDGDTNSVAVTMKHVGGNLASRFTNFLTEDGEKASRDREGEFVDDFAPGDAGRLSMAHGVPLGQMAKAAGPIKSSAGKGGKSCGGGPPG